VRELRNVIERAVLLAGSTIRPGDIAPASGLAGSAPAAMREARGGASEGQSGRASEGRGAVATGDEGLRLPPVDLDLVPLKEAKRVAGDLVERAYILAALRRTRWNKSKAAALVGLNYKTLREKIRVLELEPLRWQDPS
jgi:DNA-binding NtrC family response regulator